MTSILLLSLRAMARLTLAKYRPLVVGVTGSVGKTSTKSAIATVLKARFRVRENIKSYNNEIGLPLTIIGRESPGRSLVGWLRVLSGWCLDMIRKDTTYPQVLVLEMGADRPGDIGYLTAMAPCDVGVLTAIGPTHLEQFGNIVNVAKEKRKIISSLKPSGVAVLNIDDELVEQTAAPTTATTMTYGLADKALVRASDVHFNFSEAITGRERSAGTIFKVTFRGSSVPMQLNGVVGMPQVAAVLGAIAVGLALKLHLVEISDALRGHVSPPGRLRLLAGIKQTTIIDDTYNSSPRAILAALDILSQVPCERPARRYAVLGDMLELGAETIERHEEVGRSVVAHGVDVLLTVGERARGIATAAKADGMNPDDIFSFSTAEEAGNFLKERIQIGDVILVKASQGMRLERTVLEIMAEPARAKDLLVRQGAEWAGR